MRARFRMTKFRDKQLIRSVIHVCMHIRRTRDAREYVSSLNEAYGRDINARCTRWRLRDCRRTVRHCEPTGCSLIKHTDYVINYSQFNRELR